MRCIFLADIHCARYSHFSRLLANGRCSRFQAILDVLAEVKDFCVKGNIDTIFCLGDVFDRKFKIETDVYGPTFLAFKDLASVVKRMYILVGNHDQHSRTGKHSLDPFREFAIVVDSPWVTRIDTHNIAMIPYMEDAEEWLEFVRRIKDTCRWVLCHQGLKGAVMGAYNVTSDAPIGMDDLPFAPTPTNPGIQRFVSGHYHKHQVIRNSRGSWTYVGSPLQHSMGERGEEKGILYWLEGADDLEFYPLSAPTFHLIEGGLQGLKEFAIDTDVHRNYVRVICESNEADMIRGLYPLVQTEVRKKPQAEKQRIEVAKAEDDSKLLEEHIFQSDTELDRKELLELGLQLLDSSADR